MMENRELNKRFDMRFNKAFAVVVCSELFGDCPAIARNISQGGMFLEMSDPLPLGSIVTIRFEMADSPGDVVVRAEVKHHYCFNFTQNEGPGSTRGMGVRFIEFINDSHEPFLKSFSRRRVLH